MLLRVVVSVGSSGRSDCEALLYPRGRIWGCSVKKGCIVEEWALTESHGRRAMNLNSHRQITLHTSCHDRITIGACGGVISGFDTAEMGTAVLTKRNTTSPHT